MFNSLNKVTLIGKVGSKYPPELKVTPSGTAVLKFTMGTNEQTKDKDGNKKKVWEYHRIVIFGKLAELGERFIKGDSLICLEGRIKSGAYANQEGKEIKTFDIIADNFVILDSMPYEGKGQGSEPPAAREHRPVPASNGGYDEDIPF